jgi:hypothetical protein
MLIHKSKGFIRLSDRHKKVTGGALQAKGNLNSAMLPNNPIFGLIRPAVNLNQFSGSSIRSVNFGKKKKSNIKFTV